MAARKKRAAWLELEAGRFVCCLFVDVSHALTMRNKQDKEIEGGRHTLWSCF